MNGTNPTCLVGFSILILPSIIVDNVRLVEVRFGWVHGAEIDGTLFDLHAFRLQALRILTITFSAYQIDVW